MDILRALDDNGGAARRTELLAVGVPERALARGIASGRVVTVGRGTYALASAASEVGLARSFRAQVGCVTACAHWGLPVWGDHQVPHLVVPRSRSASRRDARELSNVVLHRSGLWSTRVDTAGAREMVGATVSRGQGPTRGTLPRLWVPVAKAIDQAGWCSTPLEQLVLVDAALHVGLILPHDLHHFVHRDAYRRTWLRRMASAASESPLETAARLAMVLSGLGVKEQVVVNGVGRVDFVVEDTVVVEVDGWEFHQSRDAFERDRARDRLMLGHGLPVMRFTASELRRDLVRMAGQVAAAIGKRPHADSARRIAWATGAVP